MVGGREVPEPLPFSAPPGWSWRSMGRFVVCVLGHNESLLDDLERSAERCSGSTPGPVCGGLQDIMAVADEHLALVNVLRRLRR